MKKFTERIVGIRGEGEHVCNHCNVAAIKAKMKQLRRMRQHRCFSAKKDRSAKTRGKEGSGGEGRIDKKGEREREAWRTRDRRPSISIALRLSLWLGFSVPFSHKSYIVSSLRSYGRGLKYSSFLPAARIHRKAGRRQTRTVRDTRMPKATATSLPSSASFAGIQSFLVHSMLVAHSVSFCRCL